MKYFIQILLWISSLGLHIENRPPHTHPKKKDSGTLSQENNHEVGRYLYVYKSYHRNIIYNSEKLDYMDVQQRERIL